jgi:hypothetical protein
MRTGIALLAAGAMVTTVITLTGCAGSGTTVPGFQGETPPVASSPTPSASVAPSVAPSATASLSPSPTATVAGTLDCGNAPLTLTAATTSYTLTGTCPSVLVEGEGITVNAPDVVSLEIRGSTVTVSAGAISTLTISGGSNVIQAQSLGTVTVSGDSNKLTSATDVAGGVINGGSNEVHAPGTIGAITGSGEGNTTGP